MMRALSSRKPPLIVFAVSALLAVVAFSEALAGDSIVGKIVAVRSAEVVTLDWGSGTYEVRIAGVDLPADRALHARARQALSKLILGKTVRLRFYGRGSDGLMYGRLLIGGIGTERSSEAVRDVGVELVRGGYVRGFDDGYKYREMSAAEGEARANKRGLWRRRQ